MDHYASLDAILDAFKAFVDKIPFYGALCACYDDPMVQGILPNLRRRLVTYGLRLDADVTARDIVFSGFETHFTPVIFGKEAPRTRLRMPGRYNVVNALASYAVAQVLEIDHAKISDAIESFEGGLHRFTVLGEERKTLVVDDYAHNPKKISTLLEGVRESFPNRFVCAVFQPHRYSRVAHLMDEFAHAFSKADAVIVTPIYSAGEAPLAGITQDILAARIADASFGGKLGHAPVSLARDLDEAARVASDTSLSATTPGGAIIVTMGAGDVRTVGTKSLDRLRKT
jgi:UDP-N-acetylmuramate--alanine ligase